MGFGDSANGGLFSSAWRAMRARATGEERCGTVGCKRKSCRQYACAAHGTMVVSALSYRVVELLHRSWPPVHLQLQRGVWWSESQTAEGAHVWYEFWRYI